MGSAKEEQVLTVSFTVSFPSNSVAYGRHVSRLSLSSIRRQAKVLKLGLLFSPEHTDEIIFCVSEEEITEETPRSSSPSTFFSPRHISTSGTSHHLLPTKHLLSLAQQ